MPRTSSSIGKGSGSGPGGAPPDLPIAQDIAQELGSATRTVGGNHYGSLFAVTIYTILIVTHNMAQARRASEECVFMLMGKVVEHGETGHMFVTPQHQETSDYIEGRYG